MIKSILATVLLVHACVALPAGHSYITDGVDAKPGEFPYQVSIQWGLPPLVPYRHFCGGSIIDENTILTAGHCILKIGKFNIVAGMHYMNQDEDIEQVINVVKTVVHEKYPGGVAQHDIAIMKLATPLKFNERVQAIKLPAQDEQQTGDAVLSGWGSVSKKFLPILPTVLQKATMPLIDNEQCLNELNAKPPVIGKGAEIFDTQICSGADGKEVSACSGDSGGPLAQFVDGVATQVGIVSWGMMPCGIGKTPSVYTRVASYIDWIENAKA